MKIDLVPVHEFIAPDEFTVTVDDVTLPGIKIVRTTGISWEIFYQSFDRSGDDAFILYTFAFSIDEVYQEIADYREIVADIRDRDHATALLMDRFAGDPLLFAEHIRDVIAPLLRAAKALESAQGEDGDLIDAYQLLTGILAQADQNASGLVRGIRDGYI